MASGDEADAREVTRIVEDASRARLASLHEASSRLVREGRSSAETERRVRRAWSEWYDEARRSIAAWYRCVCWRAHSRARAELRGPPVRSALPFPGVPSSGNRAARRSLRICSDSGERWVTIEKIRSVLAGAFARAVERDPLRSGSPDIFERGR
jgi:hypothetical protein